MKNILGVVATVVCLCTLQLIAAPTSPRQPSQHEQFIPYWTTEPGWHTELQLRNNILRSSLTVDVILRLSNGTEFSLSPVTIDQNNVKAIDLRDELAPLASQLVGTAGSFGSIVLRYSSFSTSNLYASVMIHLDGHPIEYHVDAFHVTSKALTADYDGVWWTPQPTVNQVLVLGNYSKRQTQARLSLFSDTGTTAKTTDFTLGPGQTVRVDLQSAVKNAGLAHNYGGLALHCSDAVGIYPFQFIYDESTGFSSLMKLHPPS